MPNPRTTCSTEHRADPLHVAREVIDAWNQHDCERLRALYSCDYEGFDIAQSKPIRGSEIVGQIFTRYIKAFPDLHMSVLDMFHRDGQVVVYWNASGTHTGTIMHIPPTGRPFEVRGVSILSIERGLVRNGHIIWDLAGLLRSIGLLPELSA